MSNLTPNIGLTLTPEATDETFIAWRKAINDEGSSNMTKIDNKFGEIESNFRLVTDIYPVDISKKGSDNNILYITVPNISNFSELDGKVINVYTGTYSNNKTQTVWLNVNGYGAKAIWKVVPDGSYQSSTYNAYEINRYTVMQLYISGTSVYWVNPTNSLAKGGKQAATFVIGSYAAGYTEGVVDYLCDGTADQTEINNAIAALPESGGKIVLLDGEYNISGAIDINKSNVTFEGMGGGTVLKRMFNDDGSRLGGVIKISGVASDCNLRNFAVNGNNATYTGSNNKGVHIDTTNKDLKENVIENLYIYNEKYGIFITGNSPNNIIQKNVIKNITSHGIYIYCAQRTIITNNIFSDIGTYGIYFFGGISNYNDITTNHFHNCEDGGVYLTADFANKTLVNGNIFTMDSADNSYYIEGAIIVRGADNVIINNIYPVGGYIVSDSYVNRTTFANNTEI